MQKDREALNFHVCGLKIHLMIDWHQDRGQFRQFGGEGKKKKTLLSLFLFLKLRSAAQGQDRCLGCRQTVC